MNILKIDSPPEKALQQVEKLMDELGISIEFYQNEIVLHDHKNDMRSKLVNLDCGAPSRCYEIPRVTDGDRLIYDPEEK